VENLTNAKCDVCNENKQIKILSWKKFFYCYPERIKLLENTTKEING
jgi:hypothetical protein